MRVLINNNNISRSYLLQNYITLDGKYFSSYVIYNKYFVYLFSRRTTLISFIPQFKFVNSKLFSMQKICLDGEKLNFNCID